MRALCTAVGNDDSNDEAVDTQHTRHDNGDDRLHHEVGLHHAHRGHADTRLGSAVRSAQVCTRCGQGKREAGEE